MKSETAQELLDTCRELLARINPTGAMGRPPTDCSETDKRFIEKAQHVILKAQGDLPETGESRCCVCLELTDNEPDDYGDIYCSVGCLERDTKANRTLGIRE
jgi:hypothetical protein